MDCNGSFRKVHTSLWFPSDVGWFMNHKTNIDLSSINDYDIGVMFTRDSELGNHLASVYIRDASKMFQSEPGLMPRIADRATGS